MAQTCPHCQRALPAQAGKVCIYCGKALQQSRSALPGLTAKPAPDPLLGATVAGRYHVEELIGQGGMGKVYRARHLALDKLVCLKMLKPALLEDPTLVGRFEREAKAASRLRHANVIQVLDFGRDEGVSGSLYIAMEYVQGKDLRLVLRDEWPLPEERLCDIVGQALAALADAHSQNIIHRDLKPENIMVEQRREQADFVKVLDFGIAKILDADMPGLTRADVVCGTPQYMAPEQATGSALDARCDLYAVGVILYQMATGHLPFDGQNSMEVLTKHVNEPPVPPRKKQPDAPISEAMEKLILRALEKDPANRPQTAEQFRLEILAVPAAARKQASEAVTSGAEGTVTEATLLQQPPTSPRSALASAASRGSASASLPGSAAAVAQTGLRQRFSPALLGGGAAAALAVVAVAVLALRSPEPSPVQQLQPQALTPVTAGVTLPPPAHIQPPAPTPGAPVAAAPSGVRDPAKSRALIEQSKEWQFAGDTGTARDLLEKAIGFDPSSAEAHYRLGGLYYVSQPEKARLMYQKAAQLDQTKYGDTVAQILKDL